MTQFHIRYWHNSRVDAWLYILIFLLAGVLFYLKSVATIPMEDNYYFAFVKFNYEEVGPDFIPQHISSVDDLVDSLIMQYDFSHGRIPIIGMVMLFMGVIGLNTFYVVNTVVFLIVSFLSAVYIFSYRRLTPLKLLVTILILLYCLPQTATLWYCPVLSINYLWPLGGTLLFLLLWKRDHHYKWWQMALLAPVCYLLGWSHEAFALPVICTILLMYVTRSRRCTVVSLTLTLFYIAGLVTMLLSPGMWSRTDGVLGDFPGVMSWVGNGLLTLMTNIPFDLLLVMCIWLCIVHRTSIKSFFVDNLLDISMVFFSAGMVAALTLGFSRGSIALSFFSIVLIVRIVCMYIVKRSMPRWVVVVLLVIFGIHEGAVVAESRRHYKHFYKMVDKYLLSPSGTVVYEPLAIKYPLTSPWVEPWDIDYASDAPFDRARELGISYYYGHPYHRPLHVVHPVEAHWLQHPDSLFVQLNKLPGSGGFYAIPSVNHIVRPVADGEDIEKKTFTVRYDLSDDGAHLPWKKRIKLRFYGLPDRAPLHTVVFEFGGRQYIAAAKETDMPVMAIDED